MAKSRIFEKKKMSTTKTVFTEINPIDYIHSLQLSEQKLQDSISFLHFFEKVSGYEPKMWGPSIIGFGKYAYKYESGHGGEAPMLGFSPRKAAFSLYVFTGLESHEHLLENLGKFTKGKACIYVKKASDIHFDVLEKLMTATLTYLRETYKEVV